MSPVKKEGGSTWPPNPPLIKAVVGVPSVEGLRVYRASSLGQCESALVALALGHEGKMPESLRERLDEGTRAESVVLEATRKKEGLRVVTFPEIAELKAAGLIAGYNHELQQIQVRLKIGKSAVIAGHLDGIAVTALEARPFYCTEEAKAFGPDMYKKWKSGGIAAFPGYARQISVGMIAAGMPCRFSVGRKGRDGVVSAEDVESVLIEDPPVSKAELMALVMRCEKWAKLGEVPMCTTIRWPCLVFDHPCHPESEKVAVEVEEVEEVEDAVLANMLSRYAAYQEDQRNGKRELDDLKAGVDKRIAGLGLARSVGDEVRRYRTRDETGNVVEFEWVIEEIQERTSTTKAHQRNTLKTKLVV